MMNVVQSRGGATSRLARRRTLISLIFGITIILMLTHIKTQQLFSVTDTKDDCLVSFGSYRGSKYESTATDAFRTSGETIGNKCLIQSKWMRVAQHQVQTLDNNHNQEMKVIDDWLWIDYHDRINVLVQDPDSSLDNPSFLILKQTKYALSSQESLAVVGGIIESGEEAVEAAKREVDEELHVTCNSWTPLGTYRTDVNRGMGWVHPFLARDCNYSKQVKSSAEQNAGVRESNSDVGEPDTEEQNIQSMTLSEVKASVMSQQFVEVQWSNTVALAMLHLA
mmetsp:Transcript_23984/g.39548  ORF Transcript_23984/g.39548 Transcript_23984/m.39548 type:complete len:280 (-) Transcript_23984:17-856(-)